MTWPQKNLNDVPMSDAKKVVIRGAVIRDGAIVLGMAHDRQLDIVGFKHNDFVDITITPAKPKRVKRTVWLVRRNDSMWMDKLHGNAYASWRSGQTGALEFGSAGEARLEMKARRRKGDSMCTIVRRTYWVPA